MAEFLETQGVPRRLARSTCAAEIAVDLQIGLVQGPLESVARQNPFAPPY